MVLADSAWIIASAFSAVAILLSIVLVYNHLRHYTTPKEQKWIVRILLMVPIYSVDSCLSLKFKDYALYFDVFRDTYEAYMLYCFFQLLIAFLGGEIELEVILSQKPPLKQPFGLCCLPDIEMGRKFLWRCKQYVLQFVIVKPILAILSVVLESVGHYCDGEFTYDCGYLYLTVADNISITLSMTFLVYFYLAMADELAPYRPVPKFLCIKAIVFFAFWQGVAIAALVFFDVLKPTGGWSANDISTGLQNFLICIEMVFVALAHAWAFGHNEYKDDQVVPLLQDFRSGIKPMLKNFSEVVNLKDAVHDAQISFGRELIKRKFTDAGKQETPLHRQFRCVVDFDEFKGETCQEDITIGGRVVGYSNKHQGMEFWKSLDSRVKVGGVPRDSAFFERQAHHSSKNWTDGGADIEEEPTEHEMDDLSTDVHTWSFGRNRPPPEGMV